MSGRENDLTRYARQMVLPGVGPEGQRKLLGARAAVLGVGALGSHLASGLVRAGVGYVRLVDRDFLELHNLQRQTLFDEDDLDADLPKAIAAAEKLKRVNRQVTVEGIVADITHTNVERFVSDVDIVLDGADNFELRMLVNDACLKHEVPWIYGAVIATYGMTMPILPGEGPCLRCLMDQIPAPGTTPTCDTAGVLGSVPQVIAAMQVTEALKLLTGNRDQICRDLRYVDLWGGETTNIEVSQDVGEPCPACGGEVYEYLTGEHASRSQVLCGDSGVQIRPPAEAAAPDLTALAERLEPLGDVSQNPYLLRFTVDPYELVIFQDGRTIVRGTSDKAVARSLYARYIGL